MELKNIIKDNNLEELFSKVTIGIEKEGQRILLQKQTILKF